MTDEIITLDCQTPPALPDTPNETSHQPFCLCEVCNHLPTKKEPVCRRCHTPLPKDAKQKQPCENCKDWKSCKFCYVIVPTTDLLGQRCIYCKDKVWCDNKYYGCCSDLLGPSEVNELAKQQFAHLLSKKDLDKKVCNSCCKQYIPICPICRKEGAHTYPLRCDEPNTYMNRIRLWTGCCLECHNHKKCVGCKKEYNYEDLRYYSHFSTESVGWRCKQCAVRRQRDALHHYASNL